MRRVCCHECGKSYNFDADDFCPRCGAFTQPPKSIAINADGSVVRVDGINEKNHTGSFVHAELHEENRERKRMGLSKGTRRSGTKSAGAAFAEQATKSAAAVWQEQKTRSTQRKGRSPAQIVFLVIAIIFGFNILTSLLSVLLFW